MQGTSELKDFFEVMRQDIIKLNPKSMKEKKLLNN